MSFDNLLSKIYFDVQNPGSFGGVRKLYIEAKRINPNISYNNVKSWIENQLTYSLHKSIRNNFKRNRIIVQRKNDQFEADLVDMQMFSRFNNGYKYIITIIDCFSKFLYAYPLKNKTSNEIIKVFQKVFTKEKPIKIRTDRGLEFDNNKVKTFLKDNDIIFFTSNDSKIKCAIVERVNRTLKSKMFRYFTSKGTRRYIDILQDLVDSYNNSYHRTIKMRPIDVNDGNREQVFENIYSVKKFKDLFISGSKKIYKANVGDTVRLKYDLNPGMEKSYYPLWTDRTFKIENIVDRDNKPNYKVSSENKHSDRAFYPEEIQKIGNDVVYRIEKVIKSRRSKGVEEVLVKFIGYPNEYNQWLPKQNLITIKGGSKTVPRPQLKN